MNLMRRLGRRIVRRQSHLLFELDVRAAPRSQPDGSLTVETMSAQTLPLQQQLVRDLLSLDPKNDDYLADVRKDRAIGIAILADGRIVHYAYLFKRNKTACLLGLPPGAALIGNARTIPEFRGRGLQAVSVHARTRIAEASGFAKIVAETAPDNLRSQHGLRKGGMRLVGRVELLVLMNCLVVRLQRPAGTPAVALCP